MNTGEGALRGGTGPTAESISGVERPDPDFLTPQDVDADGLLIIRRQLDAMRLNIRALSAQVDTLYLLVGSISADSSAQSVIPATFGG
jgi:hypothetical protein